MRSAPIAFTLLALLWSPTARGQAIADPAHRVDRGHWESPPAREAATRSYRPALIATYVLAPVVATAAAGLAESPCPLLGVLPGPSVVHAAHGKTGHGLLAPLAMLGSIAAGGVLFGAPATALNRCQDTLDDLGCRATPLFAASLGMVVGYSLWAVVDILENGDRP